MTKKGSLTISVPSFDGLRKYFGTFIPAKSKRSDPGEIKAIGPAGLVGKYFQRFAFIKDVP
ncbi:MAG: hypothetical protein DSY89_08625 [Deltaproteobacteria bacterium]|nr:MAG: hypothetical protein DSY89_08625 [Deltaproteobacteria bacterium]